MGAGDDGAEAGARGAGRRGIGRDFGGKHGQAAAEVLEEFHIGKRSVVSGQKDKAAARNTAEVT